jgi:HK97 family phage portal protein
MSVIRVTPAMISRAAPAPIARLFAPGRDGAVARTTLRNAWKTDPKNIPPGSAAALMYQDRGRVGKANVKLFRHWAEHSEWVRAAINIRRDQVASAEWSVEPVDPEKPFSAALQARISERLNTPNNRDKSWRTFIQPIIEDILVLDAGCIEKERTLRGEVAYLHQVDGGQIKVSATWDGEDPGEARYFWYPDYQARASFSNDDFVYIQASPATYRVVGLSPLETLKLTIDGELGGSSYNARQVQNAAPDGMLDLGESARPEQVDQFKQYWAAEVAGKGAMAFIGGTKNAKFLPFRSSNRDMQFLEFQIYYVRKIAAVFGLAAQDLGITFDVNRSTSEVQDQQTDDRGLRPLLGLVQDHITDEIVQDAAWGGPANNLGFRFTALNLKESQSRAQINRWALAGVPWKAVNEARRDDGRPPLEGDIYDKLVAVTPQGVVVLDDIPSAREVMENRKPEPAAPKPAAPKPAA